MPYGVPVSAIKAFLRTVPTNAVPPAPWLGIQGASDDAGPVRGVRVLGVHPSSPAAAAGLHGGADKSTSDTVVAIDGAPVLTPEALAGSINTRAVGDTVRVLLYGGGKYREVSLVLKSAPEDGKAAAKPLVPKAKAKRSAAPTPWISGAPSGPSGFPWFAFTSRSLIGWWCSRTSPWVRR